MKRGLIIAICILVLLVTGVGIGIFRYYHEKVTTVRTVEGAIFNQKPMAALIQTLEKMSLPAEYDSRGMSSNDFQRFEPGTTLVLYNRDYTADTTQVEALLDWVHQGNHLALAVDNHYEFRGMRYEQNELDPLLSALGIFQERAWVENEKDDGREFLGIYEYDYRSQITVDLGTSYRFQFLDDVQHPRFGAETTFETYPGYTFQLQPDAVYDSDGNHYGYMHLKHGEGKISVFIDLMMLHNRYIKDQRNAEFLIRTLTTPGVTKKLYFTYLTYPRSLFEDLLGHGWMLSASALFALLLWIWSAMPRNGPIVSEPPPERRSLAEHISASARFIWNHRADASLLEPTRSALLQRISETHAEWFQLADHAKYRFLSERARIPMGRVAAALEKQDESLADDPETFLSVISTLEHIRRSL